MLGSSATAPSHQPLSWVAIPPGVPYFVTDEGEPWTPLGHNDAIAWFPLSAVLDHSNAPERYFAMLNAHGVTCLRLMLEYAHRDQYLLERPAGRFRPRMVARWDRVFALAEAYAVRLLLTPFDTFWMWKRWRRHPYRRSNGGPCAARRRFLTCPDVRAAIKARLAFAIDRWGGSGAVFAWDLWNEIHPAYAEDDVGHFDAVIGDLATFVRERERERYGRAHLLTVSAFGPLLNGAFRSRELGHTTADPRAVAAIFCHPSLDFATVHTYAHGTIDDPRNTVEPALAMAALTRQSLAEIGDHRPFFDSEHGPIHTFKDKRQTLPEHFDDEYFRHLQWAHLASGGAGGGMRWPNRHPHALTPGMHAAQRALARFLPLVDWPRFTSRRNLNAEIEVWPDNLACCGCGNDRQAVVWVLRRGPLAVDGTLSARPGHELVVLSVPGLAAGSYTVSLFDTEAAVVHTRVEASVTSGPLRVSVPVVKDLAIAIRPSSHQPQ